MKLTYYKLYGCLLKYFNWIGDKDSRFSALIAFSASMSFNVWSIYLILFYLLELNEIVRFQYWLFGGTALFLFILNYHFLYKKVEEVIGVEELKKKDKVSCLIYSLLSVIIFILLIVKLRPI